MSIKKFLFSILIFICVVQLQLPSVGAASMFISPSSPPSSFSSLPSFTNDSNITTYYDDHARGWHWYELPSDAVEDKNAAPHIAADPIAAMNSVKAIINKALDKAILYPTPENVKNYIALQNQLSDQSSKFSKVWQKVLLSNPYLDYALIHPTNNLATQIDIRQGQQREDAAINKLAKHSGLFFFYHSTCPYCRAFAPIVKDFAMHYHIAVIPITTDGIKLPEFPDSKIDGGQAAHFQVNSEPALFAVDPYTQKAFPISYGLISEEDLRKRILDIADDFSGDL